ncbi:MAG: hypothetical protein ACK44H_09340 [Candidatus Kryptonium sp.]
MKIKVKLLKNFASQNKKAIENETAKIFASDFRVDFMLSTFSWGFFFARFDRQI